jgi:hypothetical protein
MQHLQRTAPADDEVPEEGPERVLGQPTIHHPRTADADLTRFRRALGSIALTGPIPSKKFLDDHQKRQTRRARD